MTTTLGAVVREAAAAYGDAPALVHGDRTVSYRELDRLSDRLAAGLRVRPGDLVALALPSTPDYVIAYAAVSKCGAVAAGINPRLSDRERSAILDVARPALVISPDDDLADPDAPAPAPPEDLDRPAVVCFTSGTTGAPKGAVFTGRQIAAVAAMDAPDIPPGVPMLASTEFAHVGFMTKLPWQLRLGMRVHMLGKWRAADALRTIATQRIATVGGIPAQVALMLRQPEFDDLDLTHVRTVVVGGGHSPPSLVREASERFGALYSARYSSTESGGVGTVADGEDALDSVGYPRPGVEIDIRDGEVWMRSPAQMARYIGSEPPPDGWLPTGDLGEIDDRGRLVLRGRAKEMFIRGGYNVYPLEVEDVLGEHPRVRDVAVVPRPDEVMGEIGVAVVVAEGEPPTLEELRAYASGRLAAYKLPEAIRVVDQLPLTSMHKVDRKRLAAEEAGCRA